MAFTQTSYRPIKMGQVVLRSGTWDGTGVTTGTVTVGGGGIKAFGASDNTGTGLTTVDPDYALSTLALTFTSGHAGRWWAITKP